MFFGETMELKGNFSSYSEILDLLQIVSIGKKTGEVLLSSNSESLILQLKDGEVTNFKTTISYLNNLKERVKNGELSLTEALKFVLHYVSMWEGGKFSFQEKDVTEEPIDNVDTLTVMMDFTKEQDEIGDNLKDLFRRNPSFKLSDGSNIKTAITIDREDWKLLSLLSKGESLVKAIFLGAKSFQSGLERVQSFLEKGLLEETDRSEENLEKEEETKNRFVKPETLEKIKELLIEAMGPMGELLIDETLEDMELTGLPVSMANLFIENLVEKIPDSCLIEGENCKDKLREEITDILNQETA